ncbi:MAG TPA: hypothetical protein VHE12_09590 [bacterium]|nr:hypothetical protein [bacterium]
MRSKAMVLGAMLFVGGKVGAEPYLAAWKGVNCNACHVNQTGGWLRNDFGKNYGSSLATFDWEGMEDAVHGAQKAVPAPLIVGLDIHEGYQATFYPSPVTNLHGFQSGRQALEIGVRADRDLTGVVAYRFDDNQTRELYGLLSNLPEGGYVKFGKFTTPYGLELADDNSLVRSGIGLTFDNLPSEGIEAGIYPGPGFANLSVFNGNNLAQSEHGFSGKAGLCGRGYALGASFWGQDLDMAQKLMRYGAFGWGSLGPLALLAEYDQGYTGTGVGSQDDFKAYHVSLEGDLGFDCYLRFATEWLDGKASTFAQAGYRHVVSFRCYPVHDMKFQLDLTRLAPDPSGTQYANYGAVEDMALADAFFFY